MRVVVTGKGGVGKTTLTALFAYGCAREGKTVLAVDGDPQQNLAATLGIPPDRLDRIVPLSDQKAYIAERIGAGQERGGFMVLNPAITDVVERFSVPVHDRIRLLVMGGVRNAGSGCLCPEYTLLAAILRDAARLPADVVLLDTPAGLEHFGRSIAQGFSTVLIVSTGSYNAMMVARTLSRLARQCGISERVLVLNRMPGASGVCGGIEIDDIDCTGMHLLPDDPLVSACEPSVVPLITQDTPVAQSVTELLRRIGGYR
ncbi:MAG TPA: AAA family ATPase [Methanoregulaceae archaeon]|nr:AAA family ATPase [Methanoregulaceae archaeon]